MRKVTLNMSELQKYEIIKKLVETNGSKQRVALKLNSTTRTINNLIIRYNKYGKVGFQHGNTYRSPKRAFTTLQKEIIVTFYKTKYHGANMQHFKELLEHKEDFIISYTPLRLLLLEQDCLSPKAHRFTRKKQKAKIKALLKSTKTDSLVKTVVLHNSLQALEDSHPKRARCKDAGEMIQIDASSFNWYGESIDHLHLAIDDCTGEVVGAYFDTQETLKGYYQVYKQILVKYGIPFQFLTDKRTEFEYNQKNNATKEDDTFTKFSYACSVLGTDIGSSSVPRDKGRVECLNGIFQSRLPIKLRLTDIPQ